ncbi:MAG TPA: thiamine biosynthesis protein [Acidobacteriota bacterium]|nr:thiamine biosynthesis protein [Acidobacteriota bacterium]
MEKITAIGLLSGGLDSALATKLIQGQGIEVKAVNFYTGFCTTDFRRQVNRLKAKGKVYRNESLQTAAHLGVEIDYIDISATYIQDVLMHPKYGYGKAINPCLDCRSYMLRRAKLYMEEHGAQFVFTGEVLGQRPMSQHRRALDIVAAESGLDALLVRPLSAKLLPATIPEQKGWLDREKLGAVSGRSRREQYRLAETLGVSVYSQPAGGCCSLADRNYAHKMNDLLEHIEDDAVPNLDDVLLLKVGRHFRPAQNLKVVVGRDEVENTFLERYAGNGRTMLCAIDVNGPVTIAEGRVGEEEIRTAAGITARYADTEGMPSIRVKYESELQSGIIDVAPLPAHEIDGWRL